MEGMKGMKAGAAHTRFAFAMGFGPPAPASAHPPAMSRTSGITARLQITPE